MQALEPVADARNSPQAGATPIVGGGRSTWRAGAIVVIAYLAWWGGLVALLFSRPQSFGEFGDPRALGAVFVSLTLGIALGVSLLWVAGGRLFALIVGIALIVVGLSRLTYDPLIALAMAAAGIALLYFAMRQRPGPTAPETIRVAGRSVFERVALPLAALVLLSLFWLPQIMLVGAR